MLYHAKNGRLALENGHMDYIVFGSGKETAILIPGIGDGFRTVKGLAAPFSLLYHTLAERYTVYAFSRRHPLPQGTTTKDMADDVALAMERLGVPAAHILGISQGGMIAQYVALRHPQRVKSLILAVTYARPNDTTRRLLHRWSVWARQGDYKAILLDEGWLSSTPEFWRKIGPLESAYATLWKPRDYERFFIHVKACLTHDAYDELPQITQPTLILGGSEDKIVTPQGSRELHRRVPHSLLRLYPGLSHNAPLESPDFVPRMDAFIRHVTRHGGISEKLLDKWGDG